MAADLDRTIPNVGEMRELYLRMLEGSLTHTLYSGLDAVDFPRRHPIHKLVMNQLRKRGYVPVRCVPRVSDQREQGRDWPLFAQTMIGPSRLRSLRHAIETVLSENIPGDLIEAGVWRGGASIYMRGVLKAYGVTDRAVWVADSFAGLPPPDPVRYPADAAAVWHKVDYLAVGLDEVRENFRRYDLLDDQVKFLRGLFAETLPTVRDHRWAIARLDADMYESTFEALNNLHPGLSTGGFLIVDDYSIENCRRAVTDFRAANGIEAPIQRVDWTAVYWRKT